MIDNIFWCINTGILFFLGYYLYKTQIKASLEHQMVAQKAKKDSLVNQAGLLHDACLRIKKETDEQEKLYLDLRHKIGLWKASVTTYDREYEERWRMIKETLEKKREQQREYYALSLYKKEVMTAVVAQATHELRRVFQDKNKTDAYTKYIFETMKKS